MKRTNSFVLFGRAFMNAKKDFWVSIQVLFWISLVLAIAFYYVEHMAQPEEYSNPWQAIVWAFTRYIGDPGHFAGNGPVTLTGRYIDTIIGILKILIFAVPAGLVANGFREAMNDDKKALHLEECRERIRKSFKRMLNKTTHYRMPPRNISLVTLQAKKGMTENDIIDTVTGFPEFRLRNLATSQVFSEHPQDRLVIEGIPLDKKTVDGYDIIKTTYGIKINRNSHITIIAPTSATECTIGYFSYYVAQFGGFNFVSREFVDDIDDPISYFTINDERKEFIPDFIQDIKSMSCGKNHWNIVLISADNVHETEIHFIHKMKKGNDTLLTTMDEPLFQMFYIDFEKTMCSKHGIKTDLDEQFRPMGSKNIGIKTGGATENNTFTLRLSYSITTWKDTFSPIVIDLAKCIKTHLEAENRREFTEHAGWKLQGCGFGVNELTNNVIKNKVMKILNFISSALLFTSVVALTSCSGNKGVNLAEGASGDLEEYENSEVNAIEQSRPTIMVIPGDQTLQNFKCLQTQKANGREYIIRDYKNYLLKDDRAKRIISTIQNEFNGKNFPLNDFEQTLKQLDTQEALDMAEGFEKDAKTMLLTTAQPDIILELSYDTSRDKISMTSHNYNQNGEKNVSFTLNALDAYTNKVVATMTASNIKGESTTETIQASIKDNMPKFQKEITNYFSDILTRGRDITIRIALDKGSNVKLSDESVEGDTYADWIIDYIKTHTVKGAYKMQRNTANELYFVNCRIKLLNEDGTQYGVYDWTRDLQRNLRKNLGLKCTNKAQGLGEVLISVEGI